VEAPTIHWIAPWRPIQFETEIPGVQRQLEREITRAHPLHGRAPRVVGRRIDCDDILVVLSDQTFANVHLGWGTGGDRSGQYPSWFEYGSLAEFVEAMHRDAEEYGDDAS
jgi:hypothetical protein